MRVALSDLLPNNESFAQRTTHNALTTMGPILAVDPGTVRVGLAVSDDARKFAFPLEVVPSKKAIERIRELIAERGITEIVVGMPMTLRGEIGPQGKHVQSFIRRLEKRVTPIPIRTIDERLSSAEADRYLDRPGDRDHRDAVAASVLLEQYLRNLRHA